MAENVGDVALFVYLSSWECYADMKRVQTKSFRAFGAS